MNAREAAVSFASDTIRHGIDSVSQNKKKAIAGAAYAGLLIFGTVAHHCDNRESFGQTRNNEPTDTEINPEVEEIVSEIELEPGKVAFISLH